MSGNIAVGLWLVLFCVMGLVSVKVPEWILPVAAGCAGVIVLFGSWKRGS